VTTRARDSARAAVRASLEEAQAIGALEGPGHERIRREILADLERADRDLRERLRRARVAGLGERFTGAQAELYLAQVQAAIPVVQRKVDRTRVRTSTQGATVGASAAVDLISDLEERFTGIAAPLRLRQAGRLVHVPDLMLGARARYVATSLDRYGGAMIEDFEKIIRAGLITGSSTQDIIDALSGHGGPRGTVSLAATVTPTGVLRLREAEIPEGLFVRSRYWAERLVRTELAAAYNGAKLEGLRESSTEFPDMKKKILAVLDNRTAPDSLYVHGQIRALDEEFEDGAGRRYLYPPGRPNDRETIIPWRDRWSQGPNGGERPLTLAERAMISPESLTAAERQALLERTTGDRAPARGPRALGAGATRRPAAPPDRPRRAASPRVPRAPRELTPEQQRKARDAALRERARADLWGDGLVFPTPTGEGAFVVDGAQLVTIGGVQVGRVRKYGERFQFVESYRDGDRVIEQDASIESLRARVEERLRERLEKRLRKLRHVTPEELRAAETRQAEIQRDLQGIAAESVARGDRRFRSDDVLRLHAELRELKKRPKRSLVQSAIATAGHSPRALLLPEGEAYAALTRTARSGGVISEAVATFNGANGLIRISNPYMDRNPDHALHALIHEELHGVALYTVRQSRKVPAALALEEATVEAMAVGMSGGEGLGWSGYAPTIKRVHAELRSVLGADDRPFARAVHSASSPTEVRETVAELGRSMRTGPISSADYIDHVVASVPDITPAEAKALRARLADLTFVIE